MTSTLYALFSHPIARRSVLRVGAALALAATIPPQVLVAFACLTAPDAAARAQIVVQGMESIVLLLAIAVAAAAAYLTGLAGGVRVPARRDLAPDALAA